MSIVYTFVLMYLSKKELHFSQFQQDLAPIVNMAFLLSVTICNYVPTIVSTLWKLLTSRFHLAGNKTCSLHF